MNRYLTDLALAKRHWEIPVGILSILLTGIAIQTWMEDSPLDESFFTWLLAYLAITGLMLLPLYRIVRFHLRQREARAIAGALDRQTARSIPLSEADRALGIRNVVRKIADLKRRGFLRRIEMDDTSLLLDNPEPDTREMKTAGAPDDVIRQIRSLNDEIDDEAVSQRIDRLERVTASILDTLRERPERAEDARRFMNYYLPTTLKLLESYRLMEKQSYQGETIQGAREKIEAVLDKLVVAAERQQDRLFGAEALDVEAEISVLEAMMTSDGLVKRGD